MLFMVEAFNKDRVKILNLSIDKCNTRKLSAKIFITSNVSSQTVKNIA